MLQELTIENFVLIERECLSFKDGLNIITGETGAGKSIVFSAIRVLLGQKSTKELIRKTAESARLEGVFYHQNETLSRLLHENGFEDEEGQLIISRTFNDKRSIIKINGRTCLNSFIKQVGNYLIDFHGQRDNSILLDSRSHLKIIDDFGYDQVETEIKAINDYVEKHKAIREEIESLEGSNGTVERELDLLAYQIQEISEAQLRPQEDVEIEERLDFLRNSETIHNNLTEIQAMFQETGGFSDLTDRLIQQLASIQDYDDELKKLYEYAQELVNSADEVNQGTRHYLDGFDRDEEELYELEARNDLINTLKMKYGQTVDHILEFYHDLVDQQDRLVNSSTRLEALRESLSEIEEDYFRLARSLSSKRKAFATELSKKINDELEHLNLKGASIMFEFSDHQGIVKEGIDRVEILVITNPGEDYRPIKKIASGGEISRVMLAIKSVTQNKNSEKTLIYDEIDTGISGETAEVVGERLFQLAKNNQTISVTHLPQIAVFADHQVP
jgi:DNA repair protein RecN (Recombination protein N)